MKNTRSIIEQVNANRQRRTPPSLDDLNRTLQGLERQLQERSEPRAPETARRPEPFAAPAAETRTFGSRPARAPAAVSAPAERPDASSIATELQNLRDELHREMSTGVRHELTSLGQDMARLREMIAEDGYSARIASELSRISESMQALASKTQSEDLVALREDLDELKQTLQTLAREETVSRLDNRWDRLDERFDAIESRYAGTGDGEGNSAASIEAQLDQLRETIAALPDTSAIRDFEEKLKLLATAVEHLSRQHEELAGGAGAAQMEARLDEISRAIAATGRAAAAQSVDRGAIERIEARLADVSEHMQGARAPQVPDAVLERVDALGHRMETLAARHENTDHRIDDLTEQMANIARHLTQSPALTDSVTERVAEIGQRLDAIASRYQMSDDQIGHLVEQVDAIAHRLEAPQQAIGPESFMRIEERIAEVAERIDRTSKRSPEPDTALLEAIDRRFDDLSRRIEDHLLAGSQPDHAVLESIGTRLDDLSQSVAQTVSAPAPDSEAIRSLETQVADLTRHLSSSTSLPKGFDDIAPRLESIEKSITGSQEAVLKAARKAAEEAVGHALSKGAGADSGTITGLSNDLKSLEELARRSDSRNTKTFDAIHETLLKIVERLAALETEMADHEPTKAMLVDAPSLQFDEETPGRQVEPVASPASKTPSDTAASPAARVPAPAPGAAPANPDARGSLLKGLSQAVKKRSRDKAEGEPAPEPEIDEKPSREAAQAKAAPSDDEDLDPTLANRPLEPGSGVPDLNAIMRRVREERREKGDGGREDGGKADFIAAARRAAQAAAAEADLVREEPGKKGGRSRFAAGDLIHRQRKPILMAIAAVIVAMAALQVKNAFFSPHAPHATSQTARQSAPAQAAKKPADPKPLAQEQAPESGASANGTAPAAPPKVADGAAPAAPAAKPQAAMPADKAPMGADTAEAAKPAMPAAQEPAPQAADQTPDTTKTADQASADGTAGAMATPGPTAPETAATPAQSASPAATAAAPIAVPAEIGPVALRDAAAGGDPKALFEIASRYSDGRGVQTDLAKAADWYRKAADLGFAPAEYRLANFYEKGLGVTRNVETAKTWYEKAAEQGNAAAMHNLAVLLAMGVGGKPDNAAAAHWFTQAAQFGIRDSQYNLGIMAAKGLGIPQSLVESYKWFALAAKQGDQDAAKKRDQVAASMKPDELKKARGAVELWQPKTPVAAANSVDIPDAWQVSKTPETAGIDMKKAVRNIQAILTKNGFDPGPADGVMGQKTRDAIAAFQKAHGMKPTGEVDQALVKALLENK